MNESIIKRLKERDEKAFDYVYLEYANKLCGYINSLVNNIEDAEDIMQDIFLSLFDTIQDYEEKGYKFTTWLYSIAKHKASDFNRKNKRIIYKENMEHIPESTNESVIDFDDLRRLLSEVEYKIMCHKYLDDLSVDEIVYKMNIPKRKVRSHISKAYTKIRNYLRRIIKP